MQCEEKAKLDSFVTMPVLRKQNFVWIQNISL